MFKKLLLASILAVPAVSMADGLSYRYVDANYVTVDADGGGSNPDGFNVGGSFLFGQMVFGQASYTSVSASGGDLNRFDLGAGLRHGLNSTVDLVGSAGLVFSKIDPKGPGSEDDTGYFVRGGLRALVLPKLEINGGVGYADVFNDGNFAFDAGAVFSFTPQLAVLGGVSVDDDNDARVFNIGGRFMF